MFYLCIHKNTIQIQNVCVCVQRFKLWTSIVYISSSDSLLNNFIRLFFVVPNICHRHLDQAWRQKYATYLHMDERSTQNYHAYLFACITGYIATFGCFLHLFFFMHERQKSFQNNLRTKTRFPKTKFEKFFLKFFLSDGKWKMENI